MSSEPLVAGPYTHAGSSVSRTMGLVMLALAPATLFGLVQFGWPAIFLFAVTVTAAIGAEAVDAVILNPGGSSITLSP